MGKIREEINKLQPWASLDMPIAERAAFCDGQRSMKRDVEDILDKHLGECVADMPFDTIAGSKYLRSLSPGDFLAEMGFNPGDRFAVYRLGKEE